MNAIAEPTTQPTEAPPYDGPPRTYEEALARFDRASWCEELRQAPPSCELGRGTIPDAPGRWTLTERWTHRVHRGGPTLGCGGVATWPDTTATCVMKKFGVTCVDPAVEQGYFLARGRYQVF